MELVSCESGTYVTLELTLFIPPHLKQQRKHPNSSAKSVQRNNITGVSWIISHCFFSGGMVLAPRIVEPHYVFKPPPLNTPKIEEYVYELTSNSQEILT